jgi:hypothetical protein
VSLDYSQQNLLYCYPVAVLLFEVVPSADLFEPEERHVLLGLRPDHCLAPLIFGYSLLVVRQLH